MAFVSVYPIGLLTLQTFFETGNSHLHYFAKLFHFHFFQKKGTISMSYAG